MTLQIKDVEDLQIWEKFYLSLSPALFVQSPNYARFMNNYGNENFCLGIFEGDELVGGSLVIHMQAKRGDFLYLPYGPVFRQNNPEQLRAFFQKLKKIALRRKVVCIKVSPFWLENKENYELLRQNGFRKSPLHILAETTWVLDISVPEEALLKNMRKNHRYLIRRAEKDGVTISQSESLNDLQTFIDLHQETVARHKFVPFSAEYISQEFLAFSNDNQGQVFLSHYDNKVISAAVIMFYGDSAIYRHGASASEYRKIPASYAMLWAAILEAKKRNLKYFNFWGIAPDKNPRHPFSGITLFKTGFGGEKYNLISCHDLPISSRYWLAWGVDSWRKFRRGF